MSVQESARLNLIGSPFVSVGGNRLALPTRKLLALIAVLALDGPTERARLAELLWSDFEMDARGRLRRELYRLRNTAAASLLTEQGQALSLNNISTDWHDFQAALEGQDWALAATLVRGTLLEGLNLDSIEFEEWIELHRSKFEDQQRHVLLQHALQLESRATGRETLEAFEQLLHFDALNENALHGMMRTLENLGDTTRLLAVYKQFSDRLELELGIQPSHEVRSLAAKARGERLTAPSSPIKTSKANTPTSRSSHTPLVGRKSVWTQLEAAWETGKTILICGEPGMGKSSLMLEFADQKCKSNQQVLMLNRPGDAQTPFSSLTRMLRSLLQDQNLQNLPNWVCVELARLLPELGEPNTSTDAEQGKARLLAAASAFFKQFTNDVQLLVHDDIQFMDAASWELQHNLTLHPNQSTRSIMAYRKNELPTSIQADLHAMIAADQAILIELSGLEQNAVQELVQSNFKATPEQTQALSQRLHTFTGGNPLFVLETLKAIQETGQTETTIQLPHAKRVRDIINSRLERLSKPARDLVRLAAIAPENDSLEMAAQVLGGDAMNFTEASFELERAGIMQDGRFSHDALYESALESIPKPARVLLHNRVLTFLISQPRLRGTASVYLRHAEGAQNLTQILEWSVMAAKEDTERFAYAQALAHYDRALQIETDPAKSFELLWAKYQIYSIQGQRDPWGKSVKEMRWQAAQIHDTSFEIRAAFAELELLAELGNYQEILENTGRFLERPNLSASQRAQALVIAALAFARLQRSADSEKCLLEAEPLIPLENHPLMARLNTELRAIAFQRNDLTEARHRNTLALEAWRRSGNRSGEIDAQFNAGLLSEKLGDLDTAGLNYQRAIEQAQEYGAVPFQRHSAFLLANLRLKQLDAEAAMPWVRLGMQLSIEPPDVLYEGTFHEQQAYIHSFRGEINLMLEQGRQALYCYERLSFAGNLAEQHEWLAHRLIEFGQYVEALNHIDQGQRLAELNQLAEQTSWFLLARARYHLELDQADQALKLIEHMLYDPEKRVSSRSFPTCVVMGQVCLALGMLEQAEIILKNRESYLPDEAFRLAAYLRLQIAQKAVQRTELEAAQILLSLNLPPSNALELRFAYASALKLNGFRQISSDVIKEGLKIQNKLIAKLEIEQRDSYLRRIQIIQS
jgi:DNA-binding SARP family transcriptional activator